MLVRSFVSLEGGSGEEDEHEVLRSLGLGAPTDWWLGRIWLGGEGSGGIPRKLRRSSEEAVGARRACDVEVWWRSGVSGLGGLLSHCLYGL